MSTSNQSAIDYLRSLAEQGFWGAVTFKLQSGQIIHVVKEESLKPDQLLPDHRRNHAESSATR